MFTRYQVRYQIVETGRAIHSMECMTVEGETTTEDFAAMISARLTGRPAGAKQVYVIGFTKLR